MLDRGGSGRRGHFSVRPGWHATNMCSLPPPPVHLRSHPVDVGQRSEAAILAALVQRGYPVLTPFGVNHRCDLVIDCDGQLLRAQCKTGRLRNGTVRFKTRSVRSNTKGSLARGYRGEIDLFLVYCPDMETTYAVPVEEANDTQGSLRVRPTEKRSG